MIEIIPYQDRWPEQFRQLESELKQAWGPIAKRIDHIGSTSVHGLASKDILDVMVSVKTLSNVEIVAPALIAAGFVFREGITSDHPPAGYDIRTVEWEKRVFNRYPPAGRVHLHIRVAGRANQRYALLFRDYLRAHRKAAAAYAGVKMQLAKYNGDTDDHTAYVEIKDPVCDLIMVAAEDWAGRTGWSI